MRSSNLTEDRSVARSTGNGWRTTVQPTKDRSPRPLGSKFPRFERYERPTGRNA